MLGLFKRSETLRNVSTLVAGTGIAQVILFLISPVLTRLYAPEQFASLTLFTSFVAIAGVLATCRLEFAIVLPAEDGEARQVMRLAITICAWVTLLCFIVIAAYDKLVPDSLKPGPFHTVFYLAPMGVMFLGLYNIFNFWSSRKRTFRINAAARVAGASAHAAIATSAGILGVAHIGLVLASLSNYLVSAIVTGFGFLRKPLEIFRTTTKAGNKFIYNKYRNFIVINTPHALVDSLVDNGLFFLLAYYFDSVLVGLYAFSYRLLKAPAGLIGSSIYQVLFQSMSQQSEGDLRPLVRRVYRNLFAIGIVPVFIGMFFAPWLFSFVFGAKWEEAGTITRIILPWIFLNFMVTPVSSLPLIRGKQKQAFRITLIDMSLRFASIIAGGLLHNTSLALFLISVAGAGVMVYVMIWYYKLAKPVHVDANR